MSLKIKELSPRQRRVLQKLAEGLPPAQAAREVGYCPATISRLQRSAAGREELERLRAESEAALAEALPELVRKAVSVLETQLHSPLMESRVQAAHFVLRWLTPRPVKMKKAEEDGGQIIEIKAAECRQDQTIAGSDAGNFSIEPMEGLNYDEPSR